MCACVSAAGNVCACVCGMALVHVAKTGTGTQESGCLLACMGCGCWEGLYGWGLFFSGWHRLRMLLVAVNGAADTARRVEDVLAAQWCTAKPPHHIIAGTMGCGSCVWNRAPIMCCAVHAEQTSFGTACVLDWWLCCTVQQVFVMSRPNWLLL